MDWQEWVFPVATVIIGFVLGKIVDNITGISTMITDIVDRQGQA